MARAITAYCKPSANPPAFCTAAGASLYDLLTSAWESYRGETQTITLTVLGADNLFLNVAAVADWKFGVKAPENLGGDFLAVALPAAIDKTNAATGVLVITLSLNTSELNTWINSQAGTQAAAASRTARMELISLDGGGNEVAIYAQGSTAVRRDVVRGDEGTVTNANRVHNFTATTAPTVNDDSGDGYTEWSCWADTTANKLYVCADAAAGAAVWYEVSDRQAADADLTALAALASTGLVARTGVATYSERTIAAADAKITVSNGDGVAGNPTIGLGAHASVHQHGGSDEIATATAGANAIPKAGAGGTLAVGWYPDMVGDAGAGGTKGAVPAPGVGDAAAGKFLGAGGTWSVPTGTTPAAHASSHQHGGGDEVATATPGANAVPKADGAGLLAAGWLTVMVGDSGAGGVKGAVPAPAAGDAAAGKVLKADGTWGTLAGTGDVVGPASSTDNAVARFDSTTGKLLQNSTVTIGDTGRMVLPDDAGYAPLNISERSAAPTTPAANDVYLDDGTNTTHTNPGFRRYTGAAWEDLGAAAASLQYVTGGTVAGADVTNIDIGSLSTDADGRYLLEFNLLGATGVAADFVYGYVNADYTTTNYNSLIIDQNAGVLSGFAYNYPEVGYLEDDLPTTIRIWLWNDATDTPCFSFENHGHNGLGALYDLRGHVRKTATAANITSFRLASLTASAIKIGSTYRVWKLRNA